MLIPGTGSAVIGYVGSGLVVNLATNPPVGITGVIALGNNDTLIAGSSAVTLSSAGANDTLIGAAVRTC